MNISRCRRLALAAIAASACAGAAHAAVPPAPPIDPCATPADSNCLVADATQPGIIGLVFYNAQNSRVVFFECVGDRLKRLGAERSGSASTATRLPAATTWSCDRLTRRFAAVTVLPDGTIAFGSYSVRMPSCARRFELDVPRRVKPGAKARVRVLDRWGIGGISPELCIGPADRLTCRSLAFPKAVSVVSRRFRAEQRGRWNVELCVRRERVKTSLAVGGEGGARRTAPPIVYAAGDSTMQGVDSFLADELGEDFYVRADVQPGSGISRGTYWKFRSESQTRRRRQRATVFSVGAASDGLPIPTALGVLTPCCGVPWMQEYSNRTRAIMQTFLRGGRGRVVWMTPPEPRFAPRAAITHAINIAVEHAARGLAGVKVLRIDKLFSPDGYRDVIRFRGRDVRVRESDGVHLNVAGTAIAAKAVAQAIKDLE